MAELEDQERSARASGETSGMAASAAPTAADGSVAATNTAAAATGSLRIRLKMLDERVVDVVAELSMSIVQFREKVAHATQVPVYRQRLIYRGKLLKDGTVLSAYDIQDGHTVHLVAKPVRSATASDAAAVGPAHAATSTSRAERSSSTRDAFARASSSTGDSADDDSLESPMLRRHHDSLRRLMRSDDALDRELDAADAATRTQDRSSTSGSDEPRVLRPSYQQSAPTMRRRVPGPGDPTGAAWNMGVLREALSATSDAASPPRLHGLRELFGDDVLSDTPATSLSSAAADLGLEASASSTAAAAVRPNLDHIFQGLSTLRTVLSTAAPPERPLPSQALEAQAREDDARARRYDDDGDSDAAQPRGHVQRGRRQFFVGQWIDVKDTVNQWLECTVMAMADNQVLVHYHGWPSRWDEWIDVDSPRIAAFRTHTVHSVQASHASPRPLTRVAGAPSVRQTQSVQAMVIAVRDVLRDIVPHVERLAELCDDASEPLAQADADERSELAHLVAPVFDRFGRVLMDSAQTLEPLLRPELQEHVRERQAQQTRAAAAARTRSARRPATPPSDLELRDTSLGVRDLISTTSAPPVAETTPSTRRNIDVHIHAIVAPSSLSSLASMLQGSGSTTRARVLNTATAPVGRDFDEAFGLPTYRQPLGSGAGGRGTGAADSRALLNDEADDSDDVESESRTDQSRLPLLSAYRRSGSSSSSSTGGARSRQTVDETLDSFLADDFFGTSFGHDSDDDDDGGDSGHRMDHRTPRDAAAAANSRSLYASSGYTAVSSPPRSPTEPARASGLGEIPEIAAANARAQSDAHGQSSDSSASAPSSTSSNGAGYPSFLEFMRRSLRQNFRFALSSASPDGGAGAEGSEGAAAASSDDEDDDGDMPALTALSSETASEVSSVSLAAAYRQIGSAFSGARAREPSTSSSLDEDEMAQSDDDDDDDEEMDRVD